MMRGEIPSMGGLSLILQYEKEISLCILCWGLYQRDTWCLMNRKTVGKCNCIRCQCLNNPVKRWREACTIWEQELSCFRNTEISQVFLYPAEWVHYKSKLLFRKHGLSMQHGAEFGFFLVGFVFVCLCSWKSNSYGKTLHYTQFSNGFVSGVLELALTIFRLKCILKRLTARTLERKGTEASAHKAAGSLPAAYWHGSVPPAATVCRQPSSAEGCGCCSVLVTGAAMKEKDTHILHLEIFFTPSSSYRDRMMIRIPWHFLLHNPVPTPHPFLAASQWLLVPVIKHGLDEKWRLLTGSWLCLPLPKHITFLFCTGRVLPRSGFHAARWLGTVMSCISFLPISCLL